MLIFNLKLYIFNKNNFVVYFKKTRKINVFKYSVFKINLNNYFF